MIAAIRTVGGFLLCFCLVALAYKFGLGVVEEKTSFGVAPIISILGTVVTLWAQGEFSKWRSERSGKRRSTDPAAPPTPAPAPEKIDP